MSQSMVQNTPTNGGAIQQHQPKSPTLKTFLEQPAVLKKLAEVAANFMKPNDLVRLALMAASRQPDILKCSPESVLRALMDAAAVGIVPGGTNGRGYIIPRKNRATGKLEACFDPGWRGLSDIAMRSGKVVRVEAHVVYASDVFEETRGTSPTLVHIPKYVADRGAIVAAYAVAFFATGLTQFEVLSRSDVERIKAVSAAQNGPWKDWYDQMARKSAVRRMVKYLPINDPQLDRAIEMATDTETGDRSVDGGAPALTAGDTEALEAALMGTSTVTHDATTGEVVEGSAEVA